MHSFLRTTLSICHLEIQGRLDVEKVMDDMIGVVEMSWIEKDLLDVRKQLAASKTLANMLATEANELKREKEFYDTELERIRSEAVSVRECLVQDFSSILSERRHINKYQRRIRELEDKVIELVQFVKNGSQNEGDVNQPFRSIDPQMSDENSFNQSYKFADSVVEAISSVDSASRLPTLQDSTSDPHDLLSGLEDSNLLLILSYMDVSAVSVVSQLSRHIFARLDILFQNESGSVKDSWLTRRNTQNSTAPLTNGHQSGDLTVEVTKNADAEGSYVGSSETTNGTKSPQTNGNGNGLDGPQSATKTPSGDARYFGKFSMLLAAADMLPTGLTVGVMNAVGVKMNVIPSSPASSSNGSSYGKNNSVSKPANTSAVAPVVVNGVAVGSGGTISAGGLTREIAESLSKKLSGKILI